MKNEYRKIRLPESVRLDGFILAGLFCIGIVSAMVFGSGRLLIAG
jgi:hypothetical protein